MFSVDRGPFAQWFRGIHEPRLPFATAAGGIPDRFVDETLTLLRDPVSELLKRGNYINVPFDHDRDYRHIVRMLVSKGKLKGKMLEYFRQVEATGEPLIVTDRGREVLEIRPLKPKTAPEEALARLREKAKLLKPITEEELMAPAVDWREWGQDEVWLDDK